MADHDPGVPLAHFLAKHPKVGVLFICRACLASHTVATADVVAWLQRTGRGDAQTGIREVARLRRRPCACGALQWETRPDYRAKP